MVFKQIGYPGDYSMSQEEKKKNLLEGQGKGKKGQLLIE